MGVEYIFRPIEKFPRDQTPSYKRRRTPFKAGWQDTMDKLDRELGYLHVRQCVIQLALREDQIRLDGRPRGDATPLHPGVVIAFTGAHGPLLMPCDQFTSWQANARAVALTLERLRMADMYGVTKHGEQYTGWKKLPPSTGGSSSMDIAKAALVVAQLSGLNAARIQQEADYFEAAYHEAAIRCHPDKPGGSHDAFVGLQAAATVLRKGFEG